MTGITMPRAVLVMGPESSGTRLATRILIAAGCHGDGDHEQWFDQALPGDLPLIVWRRSVPHARAWPDLARWIVQVRGTGYTVEAVVMMRDWLSMCRSQVKRQHVREIGEAEMHARFAYASIFTVLAATITPYIVLSYDNLVARPMAVQRWLAQRLNLPRVPSVDVINANAEYYL